MAVDWTAAVTVEDPFLIEFVQAFWDALNERKYAIDNTAGDPYAATTIDNTHPPASLSVGIGELQAQIEALVTGHLPNAEGSRFWVTSDTPDGVADITSIGYRWDSLEANSIVDLVLDGSGWRRKFHKEFLTPASTMLEPTDNGPPVDGDRARCLADGKLYLRDDPPGTWALDPDQTGEADVVDTYGRAKMSDIYGPWLYEDLRAVLNLLVRFWEMEHASWAGDGETVTQQWSSASADTWADAKSGAEADWTGGPGTDTAATAPFAQSYAIKNASSPYFTAQLTRKQGMLTVSTLTDFCNKQVKFCQRSRAFVADISQFDANGDGVHDGEFHVFETQNLGHVATGTSDWLGDATAMPNWISFAPGTEPAVVNQVYMRGYEQRGDSEGGVVADFGVAGGFRWY